MVSFKEVCGLIGTLVAAGACVQYIVTVLKNQTKPHAFTWVIWCIVTAIIAIAQWGQGAAAGAWPASISAFFCGVIALLSFVKGERNITRSDWVFFLGGLAIIPFWHATHNALYAVILATLIDACAYLPTIRKTWLKPQEETPVMYACDNFRWLFVFLASSDFSMTTLLYPIFCLFANNGMVAMILLRRHALKNKISV